MTKYAMIPINVKRINNKTHIRRVLISYLFKKSKEHLVTYYGTKFITADQYFYDVNSSHKYEFKNKYYKLTYISKEVMNELKYDKDMFKKKRYHYSKFLMYPQDVEFRANTKEQAIKHFNDRNELR